MSTREIVHAFEDAYGVEVSATLVSTVTDAVIDRVDAWQQRPLQLSSDHAQFIGTCVQALVSGP